MSRSHQSLPDDYYYDDLYIDQLPHGKSKKVLSLKLALLTFIAALGYSTLGSTFASNVQLGTGRVEFGQGVLVTAACDSDIKLTPFATFGNASGNNGAYKLTDIQITDLGTGCYGKDLIIRAYDSATATPLDLYQTGGATTYNSIRIYDNNGTFTLADSGLNQSEIVAVTGGFKVTLFNSASPASVAKALATSVYRITVESVEHDATLTQSLLPSGSLNFNGTSTALYYDSNNTFTLGTGDLTVEAWANISNARSAQTFYDAGGDVNSGGSFAFWIEGNQLKIRRNGINDIAVNMSGSWYGGFHHYAAVRGGGYFKIYVDGTQVASGSDTGFTIDRTAPVVGRLFNYGGYELQGQLRNLRVVKGTALYSSTFTPPTAPLTKINGTILLLLAQSSSDPAYDSSNNHFVPNNSSTLPTWNAP
jgi:hypothetical protein